MSVLPSYMIFMGVCAAVSKAATLLMTRHFNLFGNTCEAMIRFSPDHGVSDLGLVCAVQHIQITISSRFAVTYSLVQSIFIPCVGFGVGGLRRRFHWPRWSPQRLWHRPGWSLHHASLQHAVMAVSPSLAYHQFFVNIDHDAPPRSQRLSFA